MSYAWQNVTCDRCRRQYQCTPRDDYYETPQGDRCCETCLLGHTLTPVLIVPVNGTPPTVLTPTPAVRKRESA